MLPVFFLERSRSHHKSSFAALEPFLLVNCPSLLFPYLRRIASDLTRESGFQPLLLDPIDFGQLYIQRKQQEEAGSGSATPPTANA
ncbi:MAG: protein-export chaperone SecB [Pseudomonadota bacterium]